MKFICAQPAIDYYTWQVEVMINNFIENGVHPNDIEIVCSHTGEIPENWSALANTYNSVRFFFYRDDRIRPSYLSSIRPHILYKHWMLHPELAQETVFYHDCDILFSKPVDFSRILTDDLQYVSDTISYIGAEYIRSKGEQYLDFMAQLVNLDKNFIISQEKNSGGAQYLLKKIPAEFWKKVYYDSENLFRMVTNLITEENLDDPTKSLQIWCADMWAVLWNLWFFNKKVKVTEDLSFSWATGDISDWDKHPIFHNAGVTVDRSNELFYKGVYHDNGQTPYHLNIRDYDKRFCSIKYVEAIAKTKHKSCLIPQPISG